MMWMMTEWVKRYSSGHMQMFYYWRSDNIALNGEDEVERYYSSGYTQMLYSTRPITTRSTKITKRQRREKHGWLTIIDSA